MRLESEFSWRKYSSSGFKEKFTIDLAEKNSISNGSLSHDDKNLLKMAIRIQYNIVYMIY